MSRSTLPKNRGSRFFGVDNRQSQAVYIYRLRGFESPEILNYYALFSSQPYPEEVQFMANSTLPSLNSMWDFSDPAGSEARFREQIPHAIAAGDTAYHINLLTQIARTYSLRFQFKAAHQILDEAESMLSEEWVEPRLRYLLERGRTYNTAKERSKALEMFHEALKLGMEHHQEYLAIDAAHMIAIAEEEPQAQIEWNLKAIALAEQATDPKARSWLGALLNNTGWALFRARNYEKALELFEKSVDYERNENHSQYERIQRWCVARTYRAMGRIDEALALQHQLEAEYDAGGLQDQNGYGFEELGELYLLKNQTETAKTYFKRAYQYLSQDLWFVNNEPERYNRLKMWVEAE